MEYQVKTPILMIAFNRPDLTERVFEAVRKVKPGKLYFFVDKEVDQNQSDKVKATKDLLKRIDWDCNLVKIYAESHLGPDYGIIRAVSQVFSENETAIVLEDDCVPNLSFFRYCDDLLEYYKNDERVFSIGGAVYLDPMPKLDYSYWFAPLTSTWGWASWRRSWKKVDFELKDWPRLRETNWLQKKIGNPYIADNYKRALDKTYRTRNTKDFVGWDSIYHYTMLLHNAYDIRPAVNLVSNIGFRSDASHTKEKTSFADFPTTEMEFPLKHPEKITPSLVTEVEFYKQHDQNYNMPKYYLRKTVKPILNLAVRQINKIRRIFKRMVKAFTLQSDYHFNVRDYFIYIFDELAHRKIKIRELGDSDNLSTLEIRNFQFFWPKNQGRKELAGIWQEVFNTPILNPHSYEFMPGMIKSGDVVIDAGACEGFFIHYALKKGAKLYAFEPVGILTNCLEHSFETEIKNGQVKLFKNLLGAKSRTTGISTNTDMLCLSSEDEINGERCEMVSFDDWMDKNNIDKVDLIKMDIEGGEVNAFKGAAELIKRFKPKLAIAVYHEYENAKLIKDIILKYRPDYQVRFSGIWDVDGVKPRPYMIYAN